MSGVCTLPFTHFHASGWRYPCALEGLLRFRIGPGFQIVGHLWFTELLLVSWRCILRRRRLLRIWGSRGQGTWRSRQGLSRPRTCSSTTFVQQQECAQGACGRGRTRPWAEAAWSSTQGLISPQALLVVRSRADSRRNWSGSIWW